jgi:hypothetical protein
MSSVDRRPLANAPASAKISGTCNNRLGAVYSALYSFWSARHAAVTSNQQAGTRRDSYSILLFDHTMSPAILNDFRSSPDQLLDIVLQYHANGGTDFTAALQRGREIMIQNWSTER